MKTKTYPRLRVRCNRSVFLHSWVLLYCPRRGRTWAWGRYATAQAAWDAAADLLHNHWEH